MGVAQEKEMLRGGGQGLSQLVPLHGCVYTYKPGGLSSVAKQKSCCCWSARSCWSTPGAALH